VNDPSFDANDIEIYACLDQLYLKSTLPMQVTIYNISGQVISNWQNNIGDNVKTISLPGVYIVKASNESNVVTQKVVIQ
jgi:hypothetical protein